MTTASQTSLNDKLINILTNTVTKIKTFVTTITDVLDERILKLETEKEIHDFAPRRSYSVSNGQYFKDVFEIIPSRNYTKLRFEGVINYRPSGWSWYYVSFDLFEDGVKVKEYLGGSYFNADMPHSSRSNIASLPIHLIEDYNFITNRKYEIKAKLYSRGSRYSMRITGPNDASINLKATLIK